MMPIQSPSSPLLEVRSKIISRYTQVNRIDCFRNPPSFLQPKAIGKNVFGREKHQSPAKAPSSLEKLLHSWRENPTWTDSSPKVQVTVPEGSLCNLRVSFSVGLPPEAVYDIVTDPCNKRVFKNIKKVVSRRVVLEEDGRQVVELEQAAIWKFLFWSGTFSVFVLVDQNRKDCSMKFTQMKSGFMERFEGCWKIEPLFVDESLCTLKPNTLEEYDECSKGVGRVGSMVTLEQLVQPSVVPPAPISWYLRGITTRTIEAIVADLLVETGKIRQGDV